MTDDDTLTIDGKKYIIIGIGPDKKYAENAIVNHKNNGKDVIACPAENIRSKGAFWITQELKQYNRQEFERRKINGMK